MEAKVDETAGLPNAVLKIGDAAEAVQKDHIAGIKGEKTAPKKKEEKKEVKALTEEEKKKAEEEVEAKKKAEADALLKVPEEGTPEWYQQQIAQLTQKHAVLQGKYDAEITPLNTTIRQQSETIDLLSQSLDDAQQKLKAGEGVDVKPKEGEEGKEKVGLDKEEFAGYGEEMLQLVETVNSLTVENQKLKKSLSGVELEVKTTSEQVQTTSEKGFFSNLTDAVPDWEKINVDPKWLTWLSKTDPLSGQFRQAILDNALELGDVSRVVNFLNAFKTEHGIPLNVDDEVKESEEEKKKKLEEQIIPDSTATGAIPAELPGGFKKEDLVTFKQYQKAVKDASTGRITEADFDKISNQYQKQTAAGIRI